MIDTGAGLRVRRRLLLVLLVCIALPLVGGCSSDPECIAVPFLPQCFEDDDEEEKTDDTATQTRVRVNARADDIDTTMVALLLDTLALLGGLPARFQCHETMRGVHIGIPGESLGSHILDCCCCP